MRPRTATRRHLLLIALGWLFAASIFGVGVGERINQDTQAVMEEAR